MEGGWLHSGDLGEWTEQGLQLFGRMDAVFKLANGEKVSGGEVEARMAAATPLLDQTVALGNGQPYVTLSAGSPRAPRAAGSKSASSPFRDPGGADGGAGAPARPRGSTAGGESARRPA